jgi:hypothetical protein
MSPYALDEFRSARRALAVADLALAAGDTPTGVAAAFGIAESTLRSWRKRPDIRIEDEAVVRKIRRLAYKMERIAPHAGAGESNAAPVDTVGTAKPAAPAPDNPPTR